MASTDEKSPPVSGLQFTHNEKGKNPRHPMATIENDDERLLAQIGYTQVSDFDHNRSTAADMLKRICPVISQNGPLYPTQFQSSVYLALFLRHSASHSA
jgi:hypothetical protein